MTDGLVGWKFHSQVIETERAHYFMVRPMSLQVDISQVTKSDLSMVERCFAIVASFLITETLVEEM